MYTYHEANRNQWRIYKAHRYEYISKECYAPSSHIGNIIFQQIFFIALLSLSYGKNNYIHDCLLAVITHPWPNFNYAFRNPPSM